MNTNSKASVIARINAVLSDLGRAKDHFRDAPKRTGADRKTAEDELLFSHGKAHETLAVLRNGLLSDVKDECQPLFQCNQQVIGGTIASVRRKLRERFSEFPMATANAEMLLMYFEAELRFMCHFKALHTQAMAEDRMRDNPNCYGVDGEPNDVGNRVGKPEE